MNFSALTGVIDNIFKVIVGKRIAVEYLITALLAEGHVLLEDVPGVGKTLLAHSLAKSIEGSFMRIQFTPDMLPADVTGFNVYDQKKGEFRFQPGPIMANVLLADEINRTVPRTQSSLLESMQEGQVTVEGMTMSLPRPFFVIATQNPIELEGTFPLPEAQLDRFFMRVDLGYPSLEEEMLILERFKEETPLEELEPVITPGQLEELQQQRRKIIVSSSVMKYIAQLVSATRQSQSLHFGASPRASLHLMKAAQALAALRGRDYVAPDDVKELSGPVLAHRLVVDTKEKMRGVKPEEVVQEIVNSVAVPVPVE